MARFVDAPTAERCTGVVTLKDGTTADCGRRGAGDPRRCWQHRITYECPMCEHMPDGARVRFCARHECKSCETRYQSGLPGMCPSCANERAKGAREGQ